MQSTHSITRGFTGTISLGLTELIQMVCLSRSDIVIGVTSGRGKATIHISQGQIQHAQTELLTGTEAFFEVARWNDGQFEILPFENGAPCSIDKPWEHLLLEAIRQQDENGGQGVAAKPGADDFLNSGPNLDADILDGIDDVLGNLLAFDPSCALSEEVPSSVSQTRDTVKVLIVDDSSFFSKKLKEMLELDHDIEVVGVARNGKESLEFLDSEAPVDVITLDVNMPVMPGDTALKYIMIRHRTPVIIMSAQEPDSMRKIFNFLQLGAVDFVSKPGLHDDLPTYGANVRKHVKGVAKARISNFKRLRTPGRAGNLVVPNQTGVAQGKTLVIVGAEGAHMDWLRLPLARLCADGTIIGLQKLDSGIAPHFARFIMDKTGIQTEYLSAAHLLTPGKLYLSDASLAAEFMFRPNKPIHVDVGGSVVLEWEDGLALWLQRLAQQIGESLCVYYMSAAQPVSGALLDKLLELEVRQILPPLQSVVCSTLIDSIQPYAVQFPGLVLTSSADSLTEVLKKQ